MKRSIRQHQPLRVPKGWNDQERALVIQLEHLFDEIYIILSQLNEKVTAAEAADLDSESTNNSNA